MRPLFAHIATFFLLMCCSFCCSAQGLSFLNDYLGNVWVFDNGQTKQIEHQPLKSYGVGNSSMAYEDNSGGLKIYHNNFLHNASSFVTTYKVTDNIISFYMNTQLKIFDDGNFRTLCASAEKYWADDDVVIWFNDMQNMLMGYWNGETYTLDDALSSGQAGDVFVGENIAAFVDVNGWLNSFYLGQVDQLLYYKNLGSINLGRDIIAFVDNSTGMFQAFYRNEFVDLEDFAPSSYKCGDRMVAYVDASTYLKVFEDFQTRTISFDEPDFYEVEDEIMVFGVQDYFKAYVNGKVFTLESFIPEKYQINNSSVAYIDQMGNLKYFDGTKTEVISYEKVSDFELTGDAVRYSFGVKSESVYYNGKTYKND